MDAVGAKLIRLIMTGLLSFAGKICPEFICALLKELRVDDRTFEIVKLRYIDRIKFESIPEFLHKRCELRQVFKIHKDFIDRLYMLVIAYKTKS